MVIGKRPSTRDPLLEVLPGLTIFNSPNEKDAFAASQTKTQHIAIHIACWRYLLLPASGGGFWTTFSH
jgi:hypothetical protein